MGLTRRLRRAACVAFASSVADATFVRPDFRMAPFKPRTSTRGMATNVVRWLHPPEHPPTVGLRVTVRWASEGGKWFAGAVVAISEQDGRPIFRVQYGMARGLWRRALALCRRRRWAKRPSPRPRSRPASRLQRLAKMDARCFLLTATRCCASLFPAPVCARLSSPRLRSVAPILWVLPRAIFAFTNAVNAQFCVTKRSCGRVP